jgi:hypothetical protein
LVVFSYIRINQTARQLFPYISDWTHDSPAWEKLILVLIAAGIEPLNYRIERWVKEKLTRRTAPQPVQV